VGRHGLLCFAETYEVQTWRDGVLTTFVVGTESGSSPFVLRGETSGQRDGSGQVRIRRNYGFEFTSDGERRYHGEITMLGMSVQGVQVELHRMLH